MDSKERGTRAANSLSVTTMPDNSEQDEALRVYRSIKEYCDTYNIPPDNLLDILEDQKVLPMIRGKATEYVGAAFLKQMLEPREWSVDKLNLNPQPGKIDEDVSITFKRTGVRLKAETKNAVRGSFHMGTKRTPYPHFKVKCHKSRSNLGRQTTTNDRYLVGEFDLLLCNVSNSLFRGKSLQPGLQLIDYPDAIDWLKSFYGVGTDKELIRSSYDDWRMCLPFSIAEDNVLPRTPTIFMQNDPNWFSPDALDSNLRMLIDSI